LGVGTNSKRRSRVTAVNCLGFGGTAQYIVRMRF